MLHILLLTNETVPRDGILQWADNVSELRSTIVLDTWPDTSSYRGTEPPSRWEIVGVGFQSSPLSDVRRVFYRSGMPALRSGLETQKYKQVQYAL
jgi:hypothetical protein